MTTRKPANKSFFIGPSYGWTCLQPPVMTKRFMEAASVVGKAHKKHKFDAIAFTGSSGASLGFVLGIAMGIPVIYVRKKEEKTHGNVIESNTRGNIRKYIIVDDFICTGNSIRRVIDQIDQFSTKDGMKAPQCVGIYLYDDNRRDFLYNGEYIPVFR